MFTIGIAGGTGSGKTTVVEKILEKIPEDRVAHMPQDSYYRDSSHLPLVERQKMNFDHPESLRPTEHGGVEGMLPWVHAEPGLPRERTDEDADYRRLCAQSGWKPPFEG